MNISVRNIALVCVILLYYIYLTAVVDMYFVSAMSVCLFAFIFLKFTYDLGQIIEIRDVIAFIATAQWLLGPVLAYNVLPVHDLYYMSVSEETYMNYVFPGTFALIIGMYLPFSSKRIVGDQQFANIKTFLKSRQNLGYWLVAAGMIFGAVGKYSPASLRFLFFLLSNMEFVGIFLILFGSESPYKWVIFTFVLGTMAMNSVLQGMFHELIMWMLFIFIILAFIIKVKMSVKVTIFTVGIFMLLFIQSIKAEYRNATWYSDSDKSNGEIFQELALERLTNPALIFETESMNIAGARLNQGWIISRIMNHIPSSQEYYEGETIRNAVIAGIVPRVLMPNKAKAGGHENFTRFTGQHLGDGTSMNLSVIGEVYGNYGSLGGIFFMFFVIHHFQVV